MHEKTTRPEGRPLPADSAGDTISRRLREYYDAVKDETIPDRFLDLLERLDQADEAHRRATPAANGDAHG